MSATREGAVFRATHLLRLHLRSSVRLLVPSSTVRHWRLLRRVVLRLLLASAAKEAPVASRRALGVALLVLLLLLRVAWLLTVALRLRVVVLLRVGEVSDSRAISGRERARGRCEERRTFAAMLGA